MSDRSKIVGLLLKAACRITIHERAAEEAGWRAEEEQFANNPAGAAAFQATVTACRTDVAVMREVMQRLAMQLTRMPLKSS